MTDFPGRSFTKNDVINSLTPAAPGDGTLTGVFTGYKSKLFKTAEAATVLVTLAPTFDTADTIEVQPMIGEKSDNFDSQAHDGQLGAPSSGIRGLTPDTISVGASTVLINGKISFTMTVPAGMSVAFAARATGAVGAEKLLITAQGGAQV